MLEKRKYTRQELIDLYKTSRLDAIKNKIRRAGYLYTEAGRGKDYTLEITELPKEDQFNQYCIEVLRYWALIAGQTSRSSKHSFSSSLKMMSL